MKKFFNKAKFFIFAALVVLSFIAVVVSADWITDVNPADTLTLDSWNGLKNTVLSLQEQTNNIDNSVTNINDFFGNFNILVEQNSCFGSACTALRSNYTIDSGCPSSHPILIGGDCMYYDHDHTNWYPRLDRFSTGEMLNSDTYRCYCPADGNGECIIRSYCLGY